MMLRGQGREIIVLHKKFHIFQNFFTKSIIFTLYSTTVTQILVNPMHCSVMHYKIVEILSNILAIY
jgi:hypothetical protein